jgi:hypothetical protein
MIGQHARSGSSDSALLFAKTSAEARKGAIVDLMRQEGFEEGEPACAWSTHI